LLTRAAHADFVHIHAECFRVSAAAVADGAPAGAIIYKFYVTTDGDILSVNNLMVIEPRRGVMLYNHPLGDQQNANAPNPAIFPFIPSLTADSWIDTPGLGSRLGPDFPGNGVMTVGDTTNDGPQTNFQFAQLTFFPVPKGAGLSQFPLNGRISIAGQTPGTIFDLPFSGNLLEFYESQCLPEPAGWLTALVGMAVFAACRNRPVTGLKPPPAACRPTLRLTRMNC
jgi:hypothetical protein